MKLFLLALYLTLPTAPVFSAQTGTEATYGELAAEKVGQSWIALEKELETIDNSSLPHEAKAARKKVAELKEQLDLFAYAYPKKPRDVWSEARDFLDGGYEALGSFKDLFDTQGVEDPAEAEYDDKEVKEARAAVLKWKSEWDRGRTVFLSYLNNPSTGRLHERSKKDLSRFYWGATELKPDADLTGLQNLSRLSDDLRNEARGDWKEAKKIKDPSANEKDEIKFHDLRKRLRSLGRILRTFPALYNGEASTLSELDELVDTYGAVHDQIVARFKAEEAGKKKRAEKLGDEIRENWRELLEKQKDMDLDSFLKDLRLADL